MSANAIMAELQLRPIAFIGVIVVMMLFLGSGGPK